MLCLETVEILLVIFQILALASGSAALLFSLNSCKMLILDFCPIFNVV